MNDTIITLLLGIGAGIFIVLVYIYIRLKMMMKTLDKYIDDTIDEVKDSFVGMIVEKDNGIYYCYRDTDRQFLCQGANLVDIRRAFGAKYPTKTAYVATGTDAVIVAELKEALEANPEE